MNAFRAVVDHSADAILLVTAEGHVTYMNAAAEKLFGLTLAEMARRRHTDLVAERYRRHNLLETSGQLEALREGGPAFTAEWTAIPVDAERGLYAVRVRDLTDRWLAEQAIRRSEANFRALIESHPDMVGVIDGAGVIRYLNPAGVRFVGYERPDELIGRALIELLHPDELAATAELLARPGGPVRELRFVHREARIVVGEVAAIEVEYDGQPVVLIIVHDATSRRALQTQMMVAARMASVGTLAAGVAHEINNPLAYISANLEFAVRELGRGAGGEGAAPVAEVVEALEEARQGAERVRVIVRDLKTFSRAGDEERRTTLDVAHVLETALKMSWTEIRHRARFVRDYQPVPEVWANEARLGQVFLNLLVNAAQAIPEGQADANEIRASTRTDAMGRAVIEVADTGAGISPQNLSRIFDPFFTTKPTGLGTGLGLSICHGIVVALGGQLEAESHEGKGSVFRVVLPPADAPPAVEAPPAPALAPTRRLRILSVDDEPRVGTAVRRILAEHDVVTLSDGREALAKIRSGERFDVVLCDLMMPVMTGMDLHAAVRELAPDQARRMIFLTGGAFTARAREFLEQVDSPHLEKPFDAAALRAVLARFA